MLELSAALQRALSLRDLSYETTSELCDMNVWRFGNNCPRRRLIHARLL